MKNVAAADPRNQGTTKLPEIEQALTSDGADRVCSGPTVCDGDGTHCEDRQGSCKLG